MNVKRLMLEALLALALVGFAATVGQVYARAQELNRCPEGLPALEAETLPADTGAARTEVNTECRPQADGSRPVDWLLLIR